MKNILCPTDFSDAAQNGIAYAAKLAKVINGKLTLFHVQSLAEMMDSNSERNQAVVTQQLESESDEINRTFHVPCNVVVKPSLKKLSSVIKEVSSQYDLIVMGSNGPDNIYQLLTGSNAYNAAARSKCPLLIIPEQYVYSEVRNIVYAFDYLKESRLPLEKLVSFASAFKAEITVLEVMEEAESERADEDLRERQKIIQNLNSGNVQLKFETLKSSDIPLAINRYVDKSRPDILAICSTPLNFIQRLFHTSVIKNIAATADFPVVVFHA